MGNKNAILEHSVVKHMYKVCKSASLKIRKQYHSGRYRHLPTVIVNRLVVCDKCHVLEIYLQYVLCACVMMVPNDRNTTDMNQYGLNLNARNKTEYETYNHQSRTSVSRDLYFCAKVSADTNYGRFL